MGIGTATSSKSNCRKLQLLNIWGTSRRHPTRPEAAEPGRGGVGGSLPHESTASSRIRSAMRSATMIVGSIVFEPGEVGITEASATRSPDTQ